MYTDRQTGVVAKVDGDGIADLGADQRAEDAHVLFGRGARHQRVKRRIGITAVDRLDIGMADVRLGAVDINALFRIEGVRGQGIDRRRRRVIPRDLIRRNVIDAFDGLRTPRAEGHHR
jgi:hypothetical protein